jgi:hypothetical protein
MPLVMALFGREWLYTKVGHLDPWYNIGFFLYYHDSTFLADHYKLQRLSWILPGWLLYHTLGEVIGNFVLHVGALVVSTVFVYLTLARLVSRQSAFLVAACLTVYIPFHGSGGWDYQAAGAASYYALTLYLVVRAAQAEDARNWLIAAGAMYAAAVLATIHLVNFFPILAIFYFVVGERHRTRAGFRRALLYSLIGMIGLIVALCLINLAVGRGLFFFWPLLKIVLERVADPAGQKPWLLPWSAFFVPPSPFLYLAFPFLIFAASAIRLAAVVTGIGRLGAIRVLLLGQFILLALMWVIWQLLGHVALWPEYFFHVLNIPAFLALGGLLGGPPNPESRVPFGLLAGGFLLAFVPALQGAVAIDLEVSVRELMSEATAAWIVAALSAVALLAASYSRRRVSAAIMLFGFAAFSFGYLQVETSWRPVNGMGTRDMSTIGERYWTRNDCVSYGRTFREIVRLFKIFRSENPVLWQTWIWRGPKGEHTFDTDCIIDLNMLRGTLHSTGISNLGLPTDSHPNDITDEYLNYVVGGGLVVAAVQEDKDANGLIERFASYGKKLTLIRRETINLGRVPVIVLVYRSNLIPRP